MSVTPHDSIGVYAVQCDKCFKWRVIETLEEYEKIRETFMGDPWVCEKRPGVTCDDPADLEYDNSRTWVIDKPGLPKSPSGFKRGLSMRKNFSKMDCFYSLPKSGKKVRAPSEVEKFLDENPSYRDQVSVSDFSFTVPKIMEETLPANVEGSSSGKKIKASNKTSED